MREPWAQIFFFRWAAVAGLLLQAACVTVPLTWTNLAELPAPTEAESRGNPAIVLLFKDEYSMASIPEHSFHHLHHRVVKVLNEKGRQVYASARIEIDRDEEFIGFQARTIGPDGKVEAVLGSDVIQDESSTAGGNSGHRILIFRYPHVEIGSVLEYVYVTWKVHSFPTRLSGDCSWDIPIKRCIVSIATAPEVEGELRAYQTDAKPATESLTGHRRQFLEVDDIPAWTTEQFTPDRVHRVPWWLFKVNGVQSTSSYAFYYDSWAHSGWWRGHDIVEDGGHYAAGFTETIPKDGCVGRACLVNRALDIVRERTDLTAVNLQPGQLAPMRPLTAVWSSRTASAEEKVLLAWRLLRNTGVEATLAVVSSPHVSAFDPDFPTDFWFNHLAIELPPELPHGEPTWLDPSCESCAAGELPPWSFDAPALLLEQETGANAHVTARLTKATGNAMPVSQRLYDYRVTIEPSGDARIDLAVRTQGGSAVGELMRIRTTTDRNWADALAGLALQRSPAFRAAAKDRERCDKTKATCEWMISFEAPGFATVAPSGVVVPLKFMAQPAWDNAFAAKSRTNDVFFWAEESTDSAIIEAPVGMKCTWQMPHTESRVRSSPAVETEVDAHLQGTALVLKRSLALREGTFPKSEYPDIRKAMRLFGKMRNTQVTCLRDTEPVMSTPGARSSTESDDKSDEAESADSGAAEQGR
jgi:hypothetical protein